MISPLARSSVHDTMLRDSWTMIYATFPMYGIEGEHGTRQVQCSRSLHRRVEYLGVFVMHPILLHYNTISLPSAVQAAELIQSHVRQDITECY